MGFQTVPDALRAAGKAGQDVVADLCGGGDCGSPFREIAAAVPGGETPGAATAFADSWSTAFTAWCTGAERHAVALAEAADSYADGDRAAGAELPVGGPG
ncbi:hypothetical protein [Amycolatopsis sp. 195334CR]|uniref:hypothetical protein n=1 Tax=Amycolatopsis sp. 195334CR TaxID=2814588 RepID=UPI001A8CE36E|nr:hypothetical protein [Amycolatopsis sp. 195334CR]MBN6034442.1 hypothetical protein [Amycolatopsis sp. 195334CR]